MPPDGQIYISPATVELSSVSEDKTSEGSDLNFIYKQFYLRVRWLCCSTSPAVWSGVV